MKKVMLVVIDALASRIVLPDLDAGKLPTFSALIEHGTLNGNCTSIYPSITPAATASIVTGVYPVDHGIAGAFWYDCDEDIVAYYGDDFWVMIQEGLDEFFNDFLVRLNHDRLRALTLYQRVERHGLTAAALNYMWFRGETRHAVNAPWLLEMFPGVKFAPEVMGPKVLTLADFAASKIPGSEETLQASGGFLRRYGFHDDTTGEYLMHLASAESFPDFTLAYFPNNDFESHDVGPENAVSAIENVDGHLGRFIDSFGGVEAFLEEFTIIITGDHSQCDMLDDAERRAIDLIELFDGFEIAKAGCGWQESDDLKICPNMRSCHIYLHDRSPAMRDRVIARLLEEPRVDQVIWRDSSWRDDGGKDRVDPRREKFHVDTADRGSLEFGYADDNQDATGHDVHGTRWMWDGEPECIDATVHHDGRIDYDMYPNALERIACGFCDLADDLWVTAKEGSEFKIAETSIHPGGSHGALNRSDSTAPLIIAGLPENIEIPEHPRTIDVAPICLQVLELNDEAEELIKSRNAGPAQ